MTRVYSMPWQHTTMSWVCPTAPVYSLKLPSDPAWLTEVQTPSFLHHRDFHAQMMGSCSHQMAAFTWGLLLPLLTCRTRQLQQRRADGVLCAPIAPYMTYAHTSVVKEMRIKCVCCCPAGPQCSASAQGRQCCPATCVHAPHQQRGCTVGPDVSQQLGADGAAQRHRWGPWQD